jgi:hypothetical protein
VIVGVYRWGPKTDAEWSAYGADARLQFGVRLGEMADDTLVMLAIDKSLERSLTGILARAELRRRWRLS